MNNIQASQKVRNAVIILLWIPPIALVLSFVIAVSIAMIGASITYAQSGQVPNLSSVVGAVNPTTVALAVGGAVAFLYLNLLNATFGTETVEDATEQVEEVKNGDDSE